MFFIYCRDVDKSPGSECWQNCFKQEVKHGLISINSFNSTWNKEELPDQWMVSIIVLIYKKGDKTNPPQHLLPQEWKTTVLKA
jgi:hypothetical protein